MSTPWRVRLSVGPVPLRGFALLLIGWVGVGLGGNGYAAEETNPLPAIAIIIDDLGNRRPEGVDALSLPGPVTYAILPHTPLARRFADRAFSQGKEVLLHQPMESVHGLALGPGGITGQMDETQVLEVLRDNLASIPYLSGVSNHMGSLLSTREETVEWMMQAIVTSSSPSRLFFVDSRTTSGSVIARVARRSGIPTITRDVFLDNSLDPNEIRAQFHHLVKRAKSQGTALAIGHPHSTTIMVLDAELGNLSAHGVRLVKVSELLRLREISHGLTAMQRGSNKARVTRKPRT